MRVSGPGSAEKLFSQLKSPGYCTTGRGGAAQTHKGGNKSESLSRLEAVTVSKDLPGSPPALEATPHDDRQAARKLGYPEPGGMEELTSVGLLSCPFTCLRKTSQIAWCCLFLF